MRILICTQAVDREHPLLGFFHRWIETFSRECEEVVVLPLSVGSHDLPQNVTVHSLGKDEGKGKLVRLYRLLKYSVTERDHYDVVFVHMTPIQVCAAGWLWRLLGKRIGLWYTHPSVDMKLRFATLLSHVIFTGSESSFRINTLKKQVVGQGVDEAFYEYKPALRQTGMQLVVVGRLSPIKNVELAIEVLVRVKDRYNAQLHIVGGPSSNSEDVAYERSLHELAGKLGVEASIVWHGPQNGDAVKGILADADIFIHTSLTHSADKTLPEAMASKLFVISSNQAYKDDLPEISFKESDPDQYAASIHDFMKLPIAEQNDLRDSFRNCVIQKHSLTRLVRNILTLYKV